jgi:hypothetical protein
MRWELEELAREALEMAPDVCVPVNPKKLAKCLGLSVHRLTEKAPDGCEGLLVGTKIFVDYAQRAERRQFSIAHEIGHHLLRTHGLPDTENNADYIASAVNLPRLDFEPDLKRYGCTRYGWDLIALRARHRHASFEAIARRIVSMREARAVVFDWPLLGQRKAGWYTVPWDHAPTADEKLAANEARASGAPVPLHSGLTAWPVLQHDWHRVITIASL